MVVHVKNLQGELGSLYIADTDAHENLECRSIYCLTDCSFTVLTDVGCSPSDVHAITLKQGQTLFGKFTSITLASGSIKAFF